MLNVETLLNLLISTVLNLGLKIEVNSGIAKQINNENKLFMYVSCYAHVRKWCVVDVCGKVVLIRNIFGTLKKTYAFLGTFLKRNLLFEKIQQK